MQVHKYDLPSIEVDFFQEETITLHNDIELLYLLDGHVMLTVDTQEYQMAKDDLVVVNSNKPYSFASEPDSLLCRVKIPRKMIADHIGQTYFLIVCNSMAYPQKNDAAVKKMLGRIIKHYIESDNPYDLNYQGMIFQLVHHLIEHYLLTKSDPQIADYMDNTSERMQERMQRVLSYIQENYSKPITLRELSKQLYLTESYLSRFLKKTLNMNFSEYLTKIRMDYAVEDLLYTSKSITRIALDNGFSSISSFTKIFRDTYNTTPSKYKESMQQYQLEPDTEPQARKTKLQKKLAGYLGNEPQSLGDRVLLIEADADDNEPFQQPWSKFLNIGEMYSIRDYRIRSDILRLKDSLKFTHVRFYNILSDRMLLGQYISDDFRDYNFSYVDECIDFLLQNQIKPFFHMGYKILTQRLGMPIPITKLFSFSSLEDLCKVLRILFDHLFQRYGAAEVNSWFFEIWHPETYYQIPYDWKNRDGEEIYSITIYHELRKMLREAKIGGAEYALINLRDYNIRKQMSLYQKAGVDFDFISFVSYPTPSPHENGAPGQLWNMKDNFMIDEARALREIMHEMGEGHKPLWMTEYNLSRSHRNILNDTSFKGASILKNMFDVAGEVNLAGYWLMSDIYSESRDTPKILYGGNGLISKDGIYKPVYYALLFLCQCKPILLKRGPNYLLTTDGHNNYHIIIHNMQPLGHAAFLKEEDRIAMDDLAFLFENRGELHFDLMIKNCLSGTYRSKRIRLDQYHGDIIELWRRNGFIDSLRHDEINYFKNNVPEMTIKMVNSNSDNAIVISDRIEPNYFLCYKLELL